MKPSNSENRGQGLRKTYQSPKLVRYGDLGAITKNVGTAGGGDNATGKGNNPTKTH
jgi:hypothetical protein